MKIKYRVIILTPFVVLVALIFIGSFKYYEIANSDEVPLCNLRLKSNSSGFISLNIMNQGNKFTIIIPNEDLVNILNHEKWMPFPYLYITRIGRIIEQNEYLDISNELMNELRGNIINSNLIGQYENRSFLNDTSVIRDSTIVSDLDWEREKVIIYLLLKNKINCYYVHESGRTKLFLKPPHL